MKITVLGSGTSQGVPVIACDCEVCMSENLKDARLRSSVMVEENGQIFVFDTGPDFRQQMLREKVQKVDAIIYTHEHKDHVAGMDDVRAYNYKWKKDIEIYCTNRVNEALHREFPYVFSDYRYPGVPSVNVNIIENQPFEINGVEILPIEAMHYKLPIFGFRIKDFVYLTDVSSISEKEKEKMKNADLLILDALRRKSHVSHLTLDEALQLINELNPKQALLTHISHYMGKYDDLIKELPSNIAPAFDGQTIILNK